MPRENERGTATSLFHWSKVIHKRELLWRRLRKGGRELSVAVSRAARVQLVAIWLFLSRCLCKSAPRLVRATSSLPPHRPPTPPHPVRHHKALVFTYVPHSIIGILYNSQNKTSEAMRRHKNTGTSNAGQPSKVSGCSRLPTVVLKFCLNTSC